jgi:hypothetical protein
MLGVEDEFQSPLSKTKLLLPFVSFTFPEPFLPFIPDHGLFPSQFSFSISNILIAQGLEQLESRI